MHFKLARSVATGAVALFVGLSLVSTPAQASGRDITTTIRKAEAAVPAAGAFKDINSTAPSSTGTGVAIKGLEVAFNGGGAAREEGELLVSRGDGVTYTADALDAETTRLSAVLAAPQSQASWTFRGAELQQFEGVDTISVVKGGELIGVIEAPWAVDANGVQVPTHYEVRGPKLVQLIETDADTAFPVVADPTVKLRWYGVTVYLNRTETISALGGVGSCSAIFSKSPHPTGKAASVGCAAYVAYGASQVTNGKCLRVNVHGIPPLITWYPWMGTC